MLDIPAWSQNSDPLPDGRQDPFREADCGEECAAMRIYYRTKLEIPAGVVRTLIPNHSDHGETTAADLVGVMQKFGLRPTKRPLVSTAIQTEITKSVSRLTPPIILGRWLAPDTLHWFLVVGASPAGAIVNDPWHGRQAQYTWDYLTSRYAGWVIL